MGGQLIEHQIGGNGYDNSDFRDLGFERAPSVKGLIGSYYRLPSGQVTRAHLSHYLGAEKLVRGKFNTYSDKIQDAATKRTSKYILDEIDQDFYKVVNDARLFAKAFPSEIVTEMGFSFLNFSIENVSRFESQPKIIQAAKDMGFAIVGDNAFMPTVEHIAGKYVEAMDDKRNAGRNVQLATQAAARARQAELMLLDQKVYVDASEIPSLIQNVGTLIQKSGRAGVTAVAATAVIGSVLAPSIANATTPSSPNNAPTSQIVKASTNYPSTDVRVGLPTLDSVPQTISTPVSNSTETAPTIESTTVDAAVPSSQTTPTAPIAPVSAETATTAPVEQSITVGLSTAPETETSAPQAVAATPDVAPETTTTTPDAISVDVDATAPVTSNWTPVEAPVAAPISSTVETAPTTPASPDQAPLTQKQQAAQTILNMINSGESISTISALIQSTYTTQDLQNTATNFSNGQAVYPATNQSLLTNVDTLGATLEGTIQSSGHTDVSYTNGALAAEDVLDAAANDDTILQSPDIQAMVASAVRPTDPYEARLYDVYAGKAKAILEANNSALLSGFGTYAPQVESLYTYVLMASDSDAAQNAQIQAMKDSDAQAAAAAEAAKQAQEQGGSSQTTPEQEAIQDLVNGSSGVEQLKYEAMQFFMNKGLTSMQSAAIVGNLSGESGMDSTKSQYGGGEGRFLAQWSVNGGRYNGLVAYAASKGKPVTDFNTQLEYIWIELNGGYSDALTALQSAQNLTDAVSAIQTKYEITYASLYRTVDPTRFTAERDTRVSLVQGEYNQLTAKTSSIVQTRAASAAQATKDAAAKNAVDKALASVTDAEGRYTGTVWPTHYAAGQCTFGAYAIERAMGNIIPTNLTNAISWNTTLNADGYPSDATPHVGDIANTATWTSKYNKDGHVGVVEDVESNGSIDIVEENHVANNVFDIRNVPADVVKNQFNFTQPTK